MVVAPWFGAVTVREMGTGGEEDGSEERHTWPTPFLNVVTNDCTRMRVEGLSLGSMIWMQGAGKGGIGLCM